MNYTIRINSSYIPYELKNFGFTFVSGNSDYDRIYLSLLTLSYYFNNYISLSPSTKAPMLQTDS